jgi:hypothetical protein
VLQKCPSVTPLGASDELPSIHDDLARQGIPEAGPLGRPGSRPASSLVHHPRWHSERPHSCGKSPVDSEIGVPQSAPGLDGSRYAVCKLVVVEYRPTSRRAPDHVDPAFSGAYSIVSASRRLVAPERKAPRLPTIHAQRRLTRSCRVHQRVVHGHVPRSPCGTVDQAAQAVAVQASDSRGKLHFRSSCRAARPSSSRRTGVLCGAVATSSGSVSASRTMSLRACA